MNRMEAAHARGQKLGHRLALAEVMNYLRSKAGPDGDVPFQLDELQQGINQLVLDSANDEITEPCTAVDLGRSFLHWYVDAAMRTESDDYEAIANRIVGDVFLQPDEGNAVLDVEGVQVLRLLHFGIGLATEVGEFLDALKKHLFYGTPLDFVNCREELGDLSWYMAGLCSTLNADWAEVMQTNIEKLRTRYPEKFNQQDAEDRDLGAEREVLERDDD